jgi:hypothetical protein
MSFNEKRHLFMKGSFFLRKYFQGDMPVKWKEHYMNKGDIKFIMTIKHMKNFSYTEIFSSFLLSDFSPPRTVSKLILFRFLKAEFNISSKSKLKDVLFAIFNTVKHHMF